MLYLFDQIASSWNRVLYLGGLPTILILIMAAIQTYIVVMWHLDRVAFKRMRDDRIATVFYMDVSDASHGAWIESAISRVIDLSKTRTNAISILIKAAPMIGLFGSVTGMMYVFDVVSITGNIDSQAMSFGISRSIIPTAASMVVAVYGILISTFIKIVEKDDKGQAI